MARYPKIKITGKLRIKHNDGTVWESNNYIVNEGVHTASEILAGGLAGSTIYRMALGQGGYSGGSRTLPDDSWRLKDGLVIPGFSVDIDAISVTHSGQTSSMYFEAVFQGVHHTIPSQFFNEACLIAGTGSSGVLQGDPAYMGANDFCFAYRTFDELQLPSLSASTITIQWTVLLENG